MKKLIMVSLIICLFITLSGCKLDISSDIYLSDLYDFVNDSKTDMIWVNSVLRLEIVSKNTFKENKDEITSVLEEYFDNVENVRYEENSLQSFYVADIEIPLTKSEEVEDRVISFSFKDDNLYVNFNNSLFEGLNSSIFNKFYQSIEINDLSIEVMLINDLKRDVSIELQGVYVNLKPYPFLKKLTMKNRDKMMIRFSNVLRDYVAQEGKTAFVKIVW
uniref:DUF7424 domain-containing protein n=1 Tax=Dictyoglomus thermophilum TaxID=14 RepID=A0A7C3RIR8_DICTH